MPGQGWVRVRNPPPLFSVLPALSTNSAFTPGNGTVAEPGLVVVTPGRGVIMIPPVSVCHQVSTMGHRPPPIWSRYHIHASGLIGSPTLPRSLRVDRSCLAGWLVPHFMKARMAVGAVYRMVTPYRSTML